MKNFRIYFRTIGVTHDRNPAEIIKARTAEEAIEIFEARHPWSNIVAIFAA